MAVFEKKKVSKLDDTTSLTCVIEAAQNVETHIDYVIRVQRGPNPESHWQINRRYSDFVTFNEALKVSNLDLPLPPKKIFGNMDREFVAERHMALQKYLNLILSHQMLSQSLIVKRFLDPNNYPINLHETALQHVSMLFRSEPYWDVVEPLRDIGWRIQKCFFLVKPKDQPKVRQVLAWSAFASDKVLANADLVPVMKLLPTIQHPYIYPVTFATANETGGFVIRTFQGTGTLRDYLCKCKPKVNFLKKYCNPKSHTQLDIQTIKLFGRQILEALKFLHEKEFPYGHLHAGNIMLEGNTCRLLDIENSLLGLPGYYRSYITQFRKLNTLEAIDVYCFGHVLYEMTFGSSLHTASKDDFSHTVPPQIKSVLESILTSEACKTKLPTVEELLADPLFADVPLNILDKPQFRVPTKSKDLVKQTKDAIERRYKDDQKLLSSFRRLSKAQAHHNSAEEKKKRKKALKKQMSEQSTSTPPENGNNTPANGNPVSPTSSTTSTVPAAPVAPPTPAAPAAPRTPAAPAQNGDSNSDLNRSSLLGSIQNFKKGGLKRAETIDKSGPVV